MTKADWETEYSDYSRMTIVHHIWIIAPISQLDALSVDWFSRRFLLIPPSEVLRVG